MIYRILMAINTREQHQNISIAAERLRSRANIREMVNAELFNVLTTERRIIVNPDLIAHLENLLSASDYNAIIVWLGTKLADINIEITNKEAQINTTTKKEILKEYLSEKWNLESRKKEIQRQIDEYNEILNIFGTLLNKRTKEVKDVQEAAQKFNTTSNLPNLTVNYGTNIWPMNLNPVFVTTGTTPNYTFCDENWEALQSWGWGYQVSTKNGQTVNIDGLSIVGNTLSATNLRITPIEGINFPLTLDLMVRGRMSVWGIGVDHFKPLRLSINGPILSTIERENAYDALNTGGVFANRVASAYTDHERTKYENESFWNILRSGGNEAEIDAIQQDPAKSKMLIQRIRTSLAARLPVLAIPYLQSQFRADMTRMDREVPAQYLLNATVFSDYLRQNLDERVSNFIKDEVTRSINADPGLKNAIIQTLISFQSDINHDKADMNDMQFTDTLSALSWRGKTPQPLNDSGWFGRIFRRRSNKNNYTKFFKGRSQRIENQHVNTEDGDVAYSLQIEGKGINKFVATIEIKGKDEPLIIDASHPTALVAAILRIVHTKDGEPLKRKVKTHMAIDALKALVMMSPQHLIRQIPLISINGEYCDRLETFVQWNNLIMRGARVDPNTRVRTNTVIFDEQKFKNLNNVYDLSDGLHRLSLQITEILNSVAWEYESAVSWLRNKSLRNYDTRQFLRWGPIKRLWWRIRHWSTKTDFDFQTSVNAAGKNINISFEKGMFTLTGQFEWEEYTLTSRNLWSLLRKKKNRRRIFDGVELQIVEAVNENMVQQLRGNNLIASENFAVADQNRDKSGKVYIFDDSGDLSYIDIEDIPYPNLFWQRGSRCIPHNVIPPNRIRCSEKERREFFQNPILSGRLIREMKRRLALY